MASVSITYEGPPAQRQVVKATAMAPLSSLLAEACSKMNPPLDTAHATLVYNKKPLTDLSCPFRLANIPNGSSLTLLYDKPAAVLPAAAAETATAAIVRHRPPPPPVAAAFKVSATAATASSATSPSPIAAPTAPTAATPPNFIPPQPAPVAATALPAAAAESTSTAALHKPISLQQQDLQNQQQCLQQQQEASKGSMEMPNALAATEEAAFVPVAAAAAVKAPSGASTGAAPEAAGGKVEPMDVEMHEAKLNSNDMVAGPRCGGTVAASATPPAAATATDNDGGDDDDDDDSQVDHLGLGRPSALFTREALETALEAIAAATRPRASSVGGGGGGGGTGPSSSLTAADAAAAVAAGPGLPGSGSAGVTRGSGEEDDDFFEVSQEDLMLMMRSSQVRRTQEEAGGFRTRAAREAEERAKASSYSHVAIRAHLPGGTILQVSFAATETVGALRSAVLAVLAPSLEPAAYLYTTPPRQVLQPGPQDHHSLYHVGLVPAAHVHVGLDERKAAAAGYTVGAPVLRPEAAGRVRTHIGPGLAAFHGSRQAGQGQGEGQGRHSGGRGGMTAAVGVAASSSGGGGASMNVTGRSGGGGGTKLPKWMKLGTK